MCDPCGQAQLAHGTGKLHIAETMVDNYNRTPQHFEAALKGNQ